MRIPCRRLTASSRLFQSNALPKNFYCLPPGFRASQPGGGKIFLPPEAGKTVGRAQSPGSINGRGLAVDNAASRPPRNSRGRSRRLIPTTLRVVFFYSPWTPVSPAFPDVRVVWKTPHPPEETREQMTPASVWSALPIAGFVRLPPLGPTSIKVPLWPELQPRSLLVFAKASVRNRSTFDQSERRATLLLSFL